MEKTIEIPDGYEARIEGNKVILEPKESEDEKIRKQLIGFFSGHYALCKINSKEAIAYLERQKEKTNCLSAEGRKRLVETIYSDIEEVIKGAEKRLSYFPFLKSQKEQKPASGNSEKPNNHAEWSEDDKRKINRIYEILGHAADDKGFLASKRIIGDKEAIELQDFLKSLRPQPKQESEPLEI